jgi:hypothetical protein
LITPQDTREPLFQASSVKIDGNPVQERHVQTEIDWWLNSEEALFFFTGFSLQAGWPYDWLGLGGGRATSKAPRNQTTDVKGLPRRGQDRGYAPKRKFMNSNEFLADFADPEAVLREATAPRLPRPCEHKKQPHYAAGTKTASANSPDEPRHAYQATG